MQENAILQILTLLLPYILIVAAHMVGIPFIVIIILLQLTVIKETSSRMGNDPSPESQHNVWRHHNL